MKSDEQLRAKSQLRVLTDIEALKEVLKWLENSILPLLPVELWSQCQLILTEGFTNVVRHAHRNLPCTTPIDLEIKVFAHYLEMRIWDWGEPFNFEEKLETVLKQHCDPLESERGRGLIFIYKLTDERHYTRTSDQRNCLIMRKSIS